MKPLSTWLGAGAGLLFAIGTIAGNEMANADTVPGVLGHAGMALEIAGFIAFAFFAAYLYRVLTGWVAGVVLVAAAADLAIKIGSAAPLVAGYAHPDDLSPQLTQLLRDLNDAGFLLTGLTMACFVLAVSIAARPDRALPRTLTWIGLLLGFASLVTPVAAFTDPGAYNPLPYLLSLLWIIAVAVARIVVGTSAIRHGVGDLRPAAGLSTPDA